MQQPLSDVTIIYLIVVAFYLFEACCWVRSGATAFISQRGRFVSPLGQAKLVGNEHGAIYRFGWLPMDATIIAEPCPLTLSTDGVLAYSNFASLHGERPIATELSFAWSDVTEVKRQDREFWFQGRRLCKVSSNQSADDLKNAIEQITQTASSDRRRAIDAWIEQQLDDQWVASRLTEWQQATRRLQKASLMLAFWAFPVGIVCYQGWIPMVNDQRGLVGYLGILFLLWWWTAFQVYRAHRRLYPDAKLNRLKMTMTALISPAVSLRGTDLLGRNLLGMRHPLSIAANVLPAEELNQVVGVIVRDIRYPKLPDQPQSEDDWSPWLTDWQQAWLQAIEQFANRHGISMEAQYAVPESYDLDHQSYCLRCHATFTTDDAQCSLCGNRRTVPLRKTQA